MKRKKLLAGLAGLAALLLVGPARPAWSQEREPAEKAAAESKFIRLTRDADKKPVSMQTAVVRYVPVNGSQPGVSVDLIGAVHIGDKDYYDALNKLFESYDVVLYELVSVKKIDYGAAWEQAIREWALLPQEQPAKKSSGQKSSPTRRRGQTGKSNRSRKRRHRGTSG